jgi:hypothetical protein
MDDNARPHIAPIVQHFLQQEAVQTIPWPAIAPDMNPIEHVWDFIGRKINQRNPNCQNIDELRTAYASCAKLDEVCYRTSHKARWIYSLLICMPYTYAQ